MEEVKELLNNEREAFIEFFKQFLNKNLSYKGKINPEYVLLKLIKLLK